ncbi:MAG TPA: cupredoxin domain-containing protein [Actinomycetota bacterium]|nr:cupredoxin domain-containing protein [Actinomycetota bacterium]
MKRFAHMGVALAAAGILAACGGGGDAGGAQQRDGAETGGGAGTTLTMVDNAFEPAELTVSAGTEVELVNDGESIHNLTVDGIDEDVEAGQSSSVTIDLEPGEYRMVCEYHEAQGMEGTLTVQ